MELAFTPPQLFAEFGAASRVSDVASQALAVAPDRQLRRHFAAGRGVAGHNVNPSARLQQPPRNHRPDTARTARNHRALADDREQLGHTKHPHSPSVASTFMTPSSVPSFADVSRSSSAGIDCATMPAPANKRIWGPRTSPQ